MSLPPEIPVVLETTFTVAANGEGNPTKLSELINPYRVPMWVDEIRISATDYSSFFSLFTQTHTRILFGRYAITNEFVPTGVLAPRWPGDGHVVIRLQKPLYVTPQDLLVPTIRSEVSLTIRFSLVGRLAQALPPDQKIWVPYITAFQGTTVAIGNTSSQESKRTDLANPFRTPLYTRFFLGRRTAVANNVVNGIANNEPSITVRMSNHLGRPIVRDPTPFFDLFNIRDQSWTVNAMLPFGGYFLANVDVDATDAEEDQRFDISMFGYREEAVQWSI
jgi:hypothetical protein